MMDVIAPTIIVVGWVALVYQITLNAIYGFLLVVSMRGLERQRNYEKYARHDEIGRSPFTPPVSVIVPAYNEELSIVESVEALRKLDYPEVEVIVVNDGSTDGTLYSLISAFNLRPISRIVRSREPGGEVPVSSGIRTIYATPEGEGVRGIIVVDKENGGKSDALNVGILVASYPLCCTVDADSVLETDALLRATRPFLEEAVDTVAVGGLVRIANGCTVEAGRVVDVALPRRLLPLAQVVEYFRSFLGARYGLSNIGSLLVLSGAFAVFRRASLLAVGGFRTDVITEDMEVTCALHIRMKSLGRPYRVAYLPDTIAWTEAPYKLRHLMQQRMRWQRGLMDVLSIYRSALFRPKYGVLGWFAFPYQQIFEGYGPVLESFGYVLVTLGWFVGIIDPAFFVTFLLAAFLYGVVLSAASLVLQTRGRLPYTKGGALLLLGALVEALILRPLLAVLRMWAVIQHLVGSRSRWGATDRAGFKERVTPQ